VLEVLAQALQRLQLRVTSASFCCASAMSIFSPRWAMMRSASSLACTHRGLVDVLRAHGGVGQHGDHLGCTSRMPPEIAKSSFSPPGRVTTTLPGLRRVISGACLGAMPSSPSSPVATTSSASPWKISARR
jgi:hypothetical protein